MIKPQADPLLSSHWLYPALAITGVMLSSMIWSRLTRTKEQPVDRRLPLIYFAGLLGAGIGAKLVYALAEGWVNVSATNASLPVLLGEWFIGKSVTGALLCGYLAVEIAKKKVGYSRATGNFFAVITPLGLMLGRIGCLFQGCCLGIAVKPQWYALADINGIPRWPAVPAEFLFNTVLLVFAIANWKNEKFEGQLFHVYLIAYGCFRFFHEFMRLTPKILGPISGYQVAAVGIFLLGVIRYRQRARSMS